MTAPPTPSEHIALIGLGSIGISFAALHLRYSNGTVRVFDTRPDLEQHIASVLPGYINHPDDPSFGISQLRESGRLKICSSLKEACTAATIVQEQGPENIAFKKSIWKEVEKYVSPSAHLWSSTSGIAASLQNQDMLDKTRLLVVHPFNPPHIMPLIEIVPSPDTSAEHVAFAKGYFDSMTSGHRPVVIHKEIPGFVANRLAFSILREACYLVDQDVVSAQDIDVIMEASLGPRWAVQGPFKSYNMGGGTAGLQGFLENLAGTIQNVWDSSAPVSFDASEVVPESGSEGWEAKVIRQTTEAYGLPDAAQFAIRDEGLKKVLDAQRGRKG
ncbi:related to hydroxylacyl-CoA dehydrogenase [Cephalotrichum gorgonifer]|uniref:L-gulonate 3-dehydrogenase n=1 Tax=Cephalotrichum gorgonifer TaxID=2041049 RepID=A0AAE8N1L3_9PEZI|nr:related to hydroxylacyl-CoA dehydrogenase [Cephalotrichum gorgonifer]